MKLIPAVAFLLSIAALAQDKEPTFTDVLAKTGSQKSYTLKMTGGVDSISGTFENGSLVMSAKSVQVAGRGGLTIGNIGNGWVPLEQLLPSQPNNTVLHDLSKIQPAHSILSGLTSFMGPVTGSATTGFSADLQSSNLRDLVKQPWVGHKDLESAGNLKGTVKFTVSGGLIAKAEIHITGSEVPNGTNRNPPQPGRMPPRNGGQPQPGQNGRNNPPRNRPGNVTITIELSEFGTAKFPEDVKSKIGSN